MLILGVIGFFLSFILVITTGAEIIFTLVIIVTLINAIFIPLGAISAILRIGILSYFSNEVKTKLFGEIYKSLDTNLTYIPGGFKFPIQYYTAEIILNMFKKTNSVNLETQIRNLKILPEYNYIRIDDSILGTYNGHEVQIIEFSLIYETTRRVSKGGRRTEYIEVFHGALFQTSMDKHINANVFIKQKGSNLECPSILKRVNLESNEFEKIFETYSHDQIEARYFLTTATMDKLININNAGQKLSGYVCGNSISILIHATKDMFEPDISKPLNNPNNYFDAIFQAKVILDMITELNLESKTGL